MPQQIQSLDPIHLGIKLGVGHVRIAVARDRLRNLPNLGLAGKTTFPRVLFARRVGGPKAVGGPELSGLIGNRTEQEHGRQRKG